MGEEEEREKKNKSSSTAQSWVEKVFFLCGHWVLLWRPTTMAGGSGPPEEEQVERAAPRENQPVDKDPIGRDAWLVLLKGAAEARESSIEEESIEPALELLMKTWLWPSPSKLARAQITAKLSTINDWGSATKGPVQTVVSTALEDLLMVFDLTYKRKAAKEDEGNERKIRAVASGTKALEQHCLKSGDGNDHNFLDHVKDYVRNGQAAWDVKNWLVKAKMW